MKKRFLNKKNSILKTIFLHIYKPYLYTHTNNVTDFFQNSWPKRYFKLKKNKYLK